MPEADLARFAAHTADIVEQILLVEKAPDEGLVPDNADLEGIFKHQGRQKGRGLAEQDGSPETGGQEEGDAPDTVNVHMGEHQDQDAAHRERDSGLLITSAVSGGLRPLEKAAIRQDGAAVDQGEPVAEPVTPSMAP